MLSDDVKPFCRQLRGRLLYQFMLESPSTTLYDARASERAIPRPIPWAAPVTSAIARFSVSGSLTFMLSMRMFQGVFDQK